MTNQPGGVALPRTLPTMTQEAPQSTPPGWYPDPRMTGTQRYWDGERWTDHVAPLAHSPAPASSGGVSVWVIAGGILIAAIVLWFVYSVVTADNEADCILDNFDRAESGSPQKDCG